MKPPMPVFQAVTRAAAAPPSGMLTANLASWPSPPPSSEPKPSSAAPSLTPIAGWFVM